MDTAVKKRVVDFLESRIKSREDFEKEKSERDKERDKEKQEQRKKDTKKAKGILTSLSKVYNSDVIQTFLNKDLGPITVYYVPSTSCIIKEYRVDGPHEYSSNKDYLFIKFCKEGIFIKSFRGTVEINLEYLLSTLLHTHYIIERIEGLSTENDVWNSIKKFHIDKGDC